MTSKPFKRLKTRKKILEKKSINMIIDFFQKSLTAEQEDILYEKSPKEFIDSLNEGQYYLFRRIGKYLTANKC